MFAPFPAVIDFKGNCSIQEDSNSLYVNISQNISAIISTHHLRRSWRDGFLELTIIVRLRSTHTSGRNSFFLYFFPFFFSAHGSTLHMRDEDEHRDDLQFGIDPSILLVGSMPKQLM